MNTSVAPTENNIVATKQSSEKPLVTAKEVAKKTNEINAIKKVSHSISTKILGRHGVASWYGEGFHGKKTATGELFGKVSDTALFSEIGLDSIKGNLFL